MKRKIYSQLLDWKNTRHGEVALLIEGARRIGKSYIVEEFAKREYDSYLLIDFNNMATYPENITTPMVLHAADFKQEGGITYLPLYMTPLL